MLFFQGDNFSANFVKFIFSRRAEANTKIDTVQLTAEKIL